MSGSLISDQSSAIMSINVIERAIEWVKPYTSRRTFGGRGTGFFVKFEQFDKGIIDKAKLCFKTSTDNSYKFRFALTCAHCIYNCDIDDVSVSLPMQGTRTYNAVPIMFSPDNDIALLVVRLPEDVDRKLNGSVNKGFMTLGNSYGLTMGDDVYTMGFPLGGQIKITKGVFSGFEGEKGMQHTSPINYGNSGGPLFDSDGRVVGINYQGVMAVGISNIHYAQPLEMVMQTIGPALNNQDKIQYNVPRIGICYQNSTRDTVREVFNIKADTKDDSCDRGGVLIYHYDQAAIKSILDTTDWDQQGGASAKMHISNKEPFMLTEIEWDDSSKFKKFYDLQSQKVAIDCNGEIAVHLAISKQASPKNKTIPKIQLVDLLRRIPADCVITLKGKFAVAPYDGEVVSLKCQKTSIKHGSQKHLFFPYDVPSAPSMNSVFLCLMGFCFVELSENQVQRFGSLRQIMYRASASRGVMISYTFPNSEAYKSKIVQTTNIICKVNEFDMKESIETMLRVDPEFHIMKLFKQIVMYCILHDEYITITNQQKKKFGIHVDAIIKTDEVLTKKQDYIQEKIINDSFKVRGMSKAKKLAFQKEHLEYIDHLLAYKKRQSGETDTTGPILQSIKRELTEVANLTANLEKKIASSPASAPDKQMVYSNIQLDGRRYQLNKLLQKASQSS